MRIAGFIFAAVLVATSSALGANQAASDAELLDALDRARLLAPDATSIYVRIVSETPDEVREAELLLRFAEIGGADYSRIDFLAPDDLAGQIYLVTPEGTFFFGPDLDEPLAVGGSTTVFGDAAVAQTAGIRFAVDYTIGERRTATDEAGAEVLELDLVAVDFSVAFQAATVRVDAVSLRPISVVLYAVSGLPFYEVFYEEYATRGEDDVYVSVQRIENRILVGRITVSEILEVGTGELDEALFDPEQLGAGS
jgi:hypothetical protein